VPRDAYTGRALPGSIPDLFNQVREPAHRHDPPAAKDAAARVDTKGRAMAAAEAVRVLIERWGEPPTACEVGAELYGPARTDGERITRTINARKALSDTLITKPFPLCRHAGRRKGRVDGKVTTTYEPCR